MAAVPTLLVSASLSLLSGCVYLYVAWQLGQRIVASDPARLAWRFFVIWWFCLALTTLSTGGENLLAAFGLVSLPLSITLSYVELLPICLGLLGLLYYLTYLFSGKTRALVPMSILYACFYFLGVYYISASDPIGVVVGRWGTSLAYATRISGPLFVLVLLLLVFPQIIAGLAYFTLYFRVSDPTQRYRILLVSWSIVIWFGSGLAGTLIDAGDNDLFQLIRRAIGVVAALAILMAYLPPVWIRRRLRVVSPGEEALA
jgi:hypothetical protein